MFTKKSRGDVLCLVLMTCVLAGMPGCGSDSRDPRTAVFDLSGIEVSAELQPSISDALEALRTEEPDNLITRELALYTDLATRIQRPETRQDAGDELYDRWRQDPSNFTLLELAVLYDYLLRRGSERDAIYASSVLADTTTAVGLYARERRSYAYSTRGEGYYRTAAHPDSLDSVRQFWLVRKLALADSDGGDNMAAIARIVEWLPAARAAGGCSLLGVYWHDLAWYLTRADRQDDALHAAVMAVALAEKCGNRYDALGAKTTIGHILEARREYQGALAWYRECYESAKRENFPWLIARTLNRAAAQCGAMNDPRGALDLDRIGLAHSLAIKDSLSAPGYMVNVAFDHRLLGQLDSSLVYVQRARRWADAFDDPRSTKQVAFYEAEHYCHAGNYAKAGSLLAYIQGASPGVGTAVHEAELLVGLVRESRELGNPDLAYRALRRLDEIKDAMYDRLPDQNQQADLEIGTVHLLARQGEFHLAQEALSRARQAVSAGGGEGKEWEYHSAAGELALLRGDPARARQEYTRCLEIAEEGGDQAHTVSSRFQLGHLLLESGDYAGARDLFREQETEAAFGARFRTRLSSLLFMGIAYAREQRHQEAIAQFERARSLCTEHSPGDLVARLYIELGRSLAASDQPVYAEQSLLSALDWLRRYGSVSMVEELQAIGGSALRDAAEILIGLYLEYPELTAGRDPAVHTFWLAEECRWQTGPHQDPFGKPEQAELGAAGGPVLAYFVGRERSFVWTITNEGVSLYDLPERDRLLDLLAPVVADMERPGRQRDVTALENLSRTLLGPLSGAWRAGEPLRIIPDDLLFSVPWCTLVYPVDPGAGAIVLDHGPVNEATSWSAFRVGARSSRPDSLMLLAVGRDAGSVSGTSAGDAPALRHAEAEARSIAAVWPSGRSELKVGEEAIWDESEAVGLGRYGAIHLATHAVLHQGLANRATLRLAAGDQLPLTVGRVGELDLDAELVYLSCCETARMLSGAGGGLANFARAFLKAGAKSVIASTVRVDDEAASFLARRFYEHWLQGKSKAAALWAAQQDLRAASSDWRHPYYWAFYRLLGSGA